MQSISSNQSNNKVVAPFSRSRLINKPRVLCALVQPLKYLSMEIRYRLVFVNIAKRL